MLLRAITYAKSNPEYKDTVDMNTDSKSHGKTYDSTIQTLTNVKPIINEIQNLTDEYAGPIVLY